jgi:4-nitrophenyl phosphatase
LTDTANTRGLRDVRGWILDMDGVLYRETEPIDGAGRFIDHLRQEGTPFACLTNNSSLTSAQYSRKLADMGINVPESQVLTSGPATASYIREEAGPGTPVLAIGEDGVTEALRDAGLELTQDFRRARYVVVGLDRHLTYAKLRAAGLAVRNGAKFIGTNPDRTLPVPEGLAPGNGALLAFLEAATDVEPLIIGKPQAPIFHWALSHLGLKAAETGCVGDRLETDVLGGKQVGLFTVFVLSGVSTREQLAQFEPEPDAVYAGLGELLTAWKQR